MKNFIAILSMLVWLTACKHNTIDDYHFPRLASEQTIPPKVWGRVEPNNPRNPLDSAGTIHNWGLQGFVTYCQTTGDTTRTGKDRFLKSYFKKQFSVDIIPRSNTILEAQILNDYHAVYKTLALSSQTKKYLEMIYMRVDAIRSLNEFADFKADIVKIEEQILKASIDVKEKRALLATSSIIRFSAFYWLNFARTSEKVVTMGLLRKIAGVITGIAADGTSALYYAFTRATFFEMVEASIDMSIVCGYYTGGFKLY